MLALKIITFRMTWDFYATFMQRFIFEKGGDRNFRSVTWQISSRKKICCLLALQIAIHNTSLGFNGDKRTVVKTCNSWLQCKLVLMLYYVIKETYILTNAIISEISVKQDDVSNKEQPLPL